MCLYVCLCIYIDIYASFHKGKDICSSCEEEKFEAYDHSQCCDCTVVEVLAKDCTTRYV